KGLALGVRNDIFSDFYRHLQDVENAVQSFVAVPLHEWTRPQWKGFFMVMKERLGEGDWDDRGHAGGGSLTFRWHDRMDSYLVLNRDELSFRIMVADESQREAKWSELSKKLLARNGTDGIPIRPSRFRPGNRMKVAALDRDYRSMSPSG